MQWLFEWPGILLLSPIAIYVFWDLRRKLRRKRSLKYDDGVYTWTEFDGTTRRSSNHPEHKGGAWYRRRNDDHDDYSDHDGGGGD